MSNLSETVKGTVLIDSVNHKNNPENNTGSVSSKERPVRVITDTKPNQSDGSPLVNGWRQPNGYSRVVTTDFPLAGVANYHDQVDSDDYKWSETTFDGPCGLWFSSWPDVLPLPTYPLGSNIVNRAETECLAKVRKMEVQYGVAIAEAQKSVSSMRSIALEGYRTLRDIKRGNFNFGVANTFGRGLRNNVSKEGVRKAAASTAKKGSSAWLQYNYAVKPLISDIEGAVKDISAGFASAQSHITAIRNIKTNFHDRDKVDYDGLISVNRTVSGYRGVKVRLDYSLSDVWLNKISDSGLLRFDEVAWELTPYSFVVDWALPIGTFLSALGAGAGLNFKAGTKTSYSRSEAFTNGKKGRSFERSPVSGRRYGDVALSSSRNIGSVARSVYQTPPEASLYVKNPVSVSHAVSAMALFVSGFKGIR